MDGWIFGPFLANGSRYKEESFALEAFTEINIKGHSRDSLVKISKYINVVILKARVIQELAIRKLRVQIHLVAKSGRAVVKDDSSSL